jgi:hypothetical protein
MTPKKTQFEVGDLVKGDWREPESPQFYQQIRGYVVEVRSHGVLIKTNLGTYYWCAPNSIRRLKPKQRRSWILKRSNNLGVPFVDGPELGPYEIVTVREVRKAKP